MKAHELASRHTIDELTEMAREIRDLIPVEERLRTGYPPSARRKLTEISWAITCRLKDGRP